MIVSYKPRLTQAALTMMVSFILVSASFGFNGNKKYAQAEDQIAKMSRPSVEATLNGKPVTSQFTSTWLPLTQTYDIQVAVTSTTVTPSAQPLPLTTEPVTRTHFLLALIVVIGVGILVIILMHKGLFGAKIEASEENIQTKIENEVGALYTDLVKEFDKLKPSTTVTKTSTPTAEVVTTTTGETKSA